MLPVFANAEPSNRYCFCGRSDVMLSYDRCHAPSPLKSRYAGSEFTPHANDWHVLPLSAMSWKPPCTFEYRPVRYRLLPMIWVSSTFHSVGSASLPVPF